MGAVELRRLLAMEGNVDSTRTLYQQAFDFPVKI
jgi:hypothetical protein